MYKILKDKKVIFFDIGYCLVKPLSGDWFFTTMFYDLTKYSLYKNSKEKIDKARLLAYKYLEDNHLSTTIEKEIEDFVGYYSIINKELNLQLSENEIKELSIFRSNSIDFFIPYDDASKVISKLSKTYKLGIISDTWHDVDDVLKKMGIYDYFSTITYSYDLGVMKPNEKMYIDALTKANARPEDCVFIDDTLKNLVGASKLGITPILIAANPVSDIECEYTKIYSLSELLGD